MQCAGEPLSDLSVNSPSLGHASTLPAIFAWRFKAIGVAASSWSAGPTYSLPRKRADSTFSNFQERFGRAPIKRRMLVVRVAQLRDDPLRQLLEMSLAEQPRGPHNRFALRSKTTVLPA